MSDDNVALQTPRNRYLVFGLLVIAYVLATIGFLFLADLTQWIIQAPRVAYITIFHLRQELMFLSIAAFLIALIVNLRLRILGWKAVTANVVVYAIGYIGAFLFVGIMFPGQQSGAEFVSISEADQYIRRDDEVMVVELNDDARAFPHKWMRQPHIVGDTIGGEEVVMTYCALTHGSFAFSPYINDEKVNFKTFTQLQNNLIIYDIKTDEPIQQLYGTTEHTGQRLKQYPTQIMTYEVFKQIYPDGTVFYNPATGIKDELARMMLRTVINWQHELNAPVFPTIDIEQPGIKKLPLKEMVWGVRIADDKVAYSYEYFKQNNWIINTQLGGKDIVLVYYPNYRTVGGFDRNINGQTLTITDLEQIDVHGNTPQGKLNRISVASEVFWMVWYTFYPETKLNT